MNHLTYAEGMVYAQKIFKRLNGKVNPLFPARELLFDVEYRDDLVLGKSVGDIVIIYLHNIFKYVYKNRNELGPRILKGIIVYIVTHELVHLNQDMGYYKQLFPDITERTNIIECSCNAVGYNFLKMLQNEDLYRITYDLDIDLLDYGFWCKELTNKDVETQYLNSYYVINNSLDKALYCLNDFMFGTNGTNDVRNLIQEKGWKFVYLEYCVAGNPKRRELIYLHDHFVYYEIIMDVLNPIIKSLESEGKQIKVTDAVLTGYPYIAKIIIDVIEYLPLVILPQIKDQPIKF